MANFSSTTNTSCALECAVYHFNSTLRHFEYALGNYVAYEPGNPSNTQTNITKWKMMSCCEVPQLYTITTTEYKQLICAADELTHHAYNLYMSLNNYDVSLYRLHVHIELVIHVLAVTCHLFICR